MRRSRVAPGTARAQVIGAFVGDGSTLSQRVRTYVPWGFAIGCVFCLFLIPVLLRYGNHALPPYSITPLQIAITYVLSGAFGGLLVAMLYPLRRWFLGSFALGMIVVFPAYMAFSVLLRGTDPWAEAWIIGGIAAFFVGGGLGTQISSESYSRPIPTPQLIVTLWVVVAICQVVGWYLGMKWPGGARAMVGLALVFAPLYVAALATLSRRRSVT